jgi:hypothetical protein
MIVFFCISGILGSCVVVLIMSDWLVLMEWEIDTLHAFIEVSLWAWVLFSYYSCILHQST